MAGPVEYGMIAALVVVAGLGASATLKAPKFHDRYQLQLETTAYGHTDVAVLDKELTYSDCVARLTADDRKHVITLGDGNTVISGFVCVKAGQPNLIRASLVDGPVSR